MRVTRLLPYLLLAALRCLTACETGSEVATVGSATAKREPDGRIRVVATIACALQGGSPRGIGCDADGSTICVHARWYAKDDARRLRSIAAADVCAYIGTVTNFKFELVSDKPVTTPAIIVAYTDDQHHALYPASNDVVIDSP